MTEVSLPPPARMPSAPPKFSIKKDRYTSTIKINDWTITTVKRPILNGREIDAFEKELNLPLPEMTFGNNSLSLSYSPTPGGGSGLNHVGSSHSQGINDDKEDETYSSNNEVNLNWNTFNALSDVGVGEGWERRLGGGVQVSMAETWSKGSRASSLLSDTPLPTKPIKPHDWTYSTTHAGAIAGPSTWNPSTTHELPLKLLARQDPVLDQILFYDDVPLFEDELHDHGESILNVRIRVMPHSWFILSRLFMRVDNVLFRIYDVRVYHSFGSNEVVREASGMEASVDEVKAKLEKPSDLSPLTDPNFVYNVMLKLPPQMDEHGQPTLDRRPPASRTGKPWPGLGKRTDVLKLPSALDGVSNGVESMHI